MIHHDCITARFASEDGSDGRFDIIEDRDGFNVVNGSYYLGCYETEEEAVEHAEREAREYDLQIISGRAAP